MGIYMNRASTAKPLTVTTLAQWMHPRTARARPYGQLPREYKHPAFSKTSVPATREVPGIA